MQEKVSHIYKGFNQSIIKGFTLKPSKNGKTIISGKIKSCNKVWIFLEIDKKDISYLRNNCDQKYDIRFEINRTAFQMQHNALKLIKEHNLFPILINNPKYNSSNSTVLSETQFSFNGKLADNLNEEQKLAVHNIVKATNYPLPYIVFGPAFDT